MKKLLQKLGLVLGLPFAATVIAFINPNVGLVFVLAVVTACAVAVFRPLPRLGLGNKLFSAFLLVWVGLIGSFMVVASNTGTQNAELAALRVSDPAAYLATLRERDEQQWLTALSELDPAAFEAEQARRAAEVAERERLAAAQAEAAAEAERVAAEAAERERLAATEAEAAAEAARQAEAVERERLALEEAAAAAEAERQRQPQPTQVASNVVQQARESVALWQPISVTITGSTLRIILPQRQVTTQIYEAVIQAGICMGVLAGNTLAGVRSIEVLNEFSRQGFVYEAGTDDCEQINAIPGGPDGARRVGLMIAARTHGHFNR